MAGSGREISFRYWNLELGTGAGLGHHDDKLRLAEVVGPDAVWPDAD